MLDVVDADSLEDLIKSTIPAALMAKEAFNLPTAESEVSTLERLREFAAGNVPAKSFIGQGYYGTHVPNVIASKRVGESRLVYRLYALSS